MKPYKIATERNKYLKDLINEIKADAAQPITLSAIATALNDAGYETARGKKFTKTQVFRIME